MLPTSNNGPDRTDDLLQKRAEISLRLHRASVGVVVILGVVITLALLALGAAYLGQDNLKKAVSASAEAQKQLHQSYLSQSRAERASKTLGSKARAMEVIQAAGALQPGPSLMHEANQVLATTDLGLPIVSWTNVAGTHGLEVDPQLKLYSRRTLHGECRIYRVADNQLVATLPGPKSPLGFSRFNQDGTLIALRFADGTIRVWELKSEPKLIFEIRLENPGNQGEFGLSFSPDDQLLAAAFPVENRIRIFRFRASAELPSVSSVRPEFVAFSPVDPEVIAVLGRGEGLHVKMIKTGATLAELKHTSWMASMVWAAQGRYIALGTETGECLRFDTQSKRVQIFRGHETFAQAQINPSGSLLATSSWDGTAKLWDGHSGYLMLGTGAGFPLAFSTDGLQLAYYREPGGIGVWPVSESEVFRTYSCLGGGRKIVFSLDASPDGRHLAVMREDGLHLLKTGTGEEVAFKQIDRQWAHNVKFHPTNNLLYASARDGVHSWRTEERDGKVQLVPVKFIPAPKGWEAYSFRIAEDYNSILVNLSDRHLILFKYDQPTNFLAFTNYTVPRSFALSPDARQVVISASGGLGTRLLDGTTAKVLRQLSDENANVEFSPDGKWVVLSKSDEVTLYALPDWKPIKRYPITFSRIFAGLVAFSHDAKYLALTTSDSELRLLHLKESHDDQVLNSPRLGNMNCLAFDKKVARLYIGTQSADLVHEWDFGAAAEKAARLGGFILERDKPQVAKSVLASSTAWFSRFQQILFLILAGVILTLGLAFLILQRHRQLFQDYLQTEAILVEKDKTLKAAQAEVLHSHKMTALGTLSAGIAHDFNNLLQVIRMANDLIGEAPTKKEIMENVAEIDQAVGQGRQVVRSLLGYAREGAGEPQSYDVPELTERLVNLLKKQFLGGIQVSIAFEANLPQPHGQPARLEQILLNLIINSAEAMRLKGALRIEATLSAMPASCKLRPAAASRYIQMSIQDDGEGIAPETIDRIFEPFFTTKNAGANRGTGLGLSLVYNLAEKEGIGLAVQSVPGAGATFLLFIPIDPIATVPNPSASEPI